jgi:hypothetical protein
MGFRSAPESSGQSVTAKSRARCKSNLLGKLLTQALCDRTSLRRRSGRDGRIEDDPKTRHDSNGLRPKKTARWGDDHKAVHYQRRILPRGRRGRGARRWSTRSKTTRTRISSPQIVGQARRSGVGLCGWHHREHGGRVNDGGARRYLMLNYRPPKCLAIRSASLTV